MLKRYFTKDLREPIFNLNEWAWSDCEIKDRKTNTSIFKRKVFFPKGWSSNAIQITASKYFTDKENSFKQVLDRIVDTLTKAGLKQGLLVGESTKGAVGDLNTSLIFQDELYHLLMTQRAAFNSPVYFNVGVENRKQQCSACFLLNVEDHMDSILDWIKTEGMVFKGGSGTGVNISKLRARGEPIRPRGTSSGPLSFMAGADCMSGIVKSGSVARRAAKMVLMDVDHPDIEEFINCKVKAEETLRKFRNIGVDIDVNNELLSFIPYQNANNSVVVSDRFLRRTDMDTSPWELNKRTGGISKTLSSKKLFNQICEAAWQCADPGLFFVDTINRWHTCKNSGPITTCNPCAEYVFLTDTACNLSSINLVKFISQDDTTKRWTFDVKGFEAAVRVLITAQEIIVDYSDYPTEAISKKTRQFRTLGLGFSNLGSMLMQMGIPYDSDEGRWLATVITSLMTAVAYDQSSKMAEKVGEFEEFQHNKRDFMTVMKEHKSFSEGLVRVMMERKNGTEIVDKIDGLHDACLLADGYWGDVTIAKTFRNAQVTLIAPTGTISFMMDCTTTGIEPELALRKKKTLVGGGELTIINSDAETALRSLGYPEDTIDGIVDYVKQENTVEGSGVLTEHLPIFDCSFKGGGTRFIRPMGHVLMVAAVQPFLSGAISKTINLPADATVKDIERVYMAAWSHGVKSISVYRDSSKVAQPVKAEIKTKDVIELKEELKTPDWGPFPGIGVERKFGGADDKDPGTIYIGDSGLEEQVTVPSPLSVGPIVPIGGLKEPTGSNGRAKRHRLPDTRHSMTHKFSIGGHEGYLTIGLYEDNTPGEIFVNISKEGSTISGLMDSFALSISIGLQYGVPLKVLVDKFSYTRFEPSGFTQNKDMPTATSIVDYIFRYMEKQFCKSESPSVEKPIPTFTDYAQMIIKANGHTNGNGQTCANCGSETVLAGNCQSCPTCGETGGCG